MGQNKLILMGFTQEIFPAGTHMCLIYAAESARRKIIGKFLESGLLDKEKMADFVDTLTPEEVPGWLRNMGAALPENDDFAITEAEGTCCPGGEFVPETMLLLLREFCGQIKLAGCSNGRVSGEMSWALKGVPGSNRLLGYEARVNGVLSTQPITAICQDETNRFSGATILDVLKVHPMMVVHGQIVQNPSYLKPRDFLNDDEQGR